MDDGREVVCGFWRVGQPRHEVGLLGFAASSPNHGRCHQREAGVLSQKGIEWAAFLAVGQPARELRRRDALLQFAYGAPQRKREFKPELVAGV